MQQAGGLGVVRLHFMETTLQGGVEMARVVMLTPCKATRRKLSLCGHHTHTHTCPEALLPAGRDITCHVSPPLAQRCVFSLARWIMAHEANPVS